MNPLPTDLEVRPKPRWIRMIGGGVALGLVGVLAGNLLFVPPPKPALIEGLAGPWDAVNTALERRVARRFPAGSSEAALAEELRRQGFAVGSDRRAKWSREVFPCKDFVEVDWRAEAGRIVSTDASWFQACT